jgi:hypothetical protein
MHTASIGISLRACCLIVVAHSIGLRLVAGNFGWCVRPSLPETRSDDRHQSQNLGIRLIYSFTSVVLHTVPLMVKLAALDSKGVETDI